MPLGGEIDSDVVIQTDGSEDLLFEILAEILARDGGHRTELRSGIGSCDLALKAVFGVEHLEGAEKRRPFEVPCDFPRFLTAAGFEEEGEQES